MSIKLNVLQLKIRFRLFCYDASFIPKVITSSTANKYGCISNHQLYLYLVMYFRVMKLSGVLGGA